MSKKQSKNLQKVQEMLDGNYKSKTMIGYADGDVHANREIGERWFDHDGKEWEKTEWGRKTVDKLPAVGLGDNCSEEDCKKLIIKIWDKDTFKADGRCYHCQLNYELDLKFESKLRWFAYRRLKDLQNMESLEKDMIQWVDEMTKQREKNKRFESLNKYENTLNFRLLKTEKQYIMSNKELLSSRNRWHSNLTKDLYLEEGVKALEMLSLLDKNIILANNDKLLK